MLKQLMHFGSSDVCAYTVSKSITDTVDKKMLVNVDGGKSLYSIKIVFTDYFHVLASLK